MTSEARSGSDTETRQGVSDLSYAEAGIELDRIIDEFETEGLYDAACWDRAMDSPDRGRVTARNEEDLLLQTRLVDLLPGGRSGRDYSFESGGLRVRAKHNIVDGQSGSQADGLVVC